MFAQSAILATRRVLSNLSAFWRGCAAAPIRRGRRPVYSTVHSKDSTDGPLGLAVRAVSPLRHVHCTRLDELAPEAAELRAPFGREHRNEAMAAASATFDAISCVLSATLPNSGATLLLAEACAGAMKAQDACGRGARARDRRVCDPARHRGDVFRIVAEGAKLEFRRAAAFDDGAAVFDLGGAVQHGGVPGDVARSPGRAARRSRPARPWRQRCNRCRSAGRAICSPPQSRVRPR